MIFLNKEGEIGLIGIEIEIEGKGKMKSDDEACIFKIHNKKDAIEMLKKATPDFQSGLIIATVLKYEGIYISIDELNNIRKYSTINEYIEKTTHNKV